MNDPARGTLTRRTLLIDREFQLKYAGLLALAGLIIAGVFAVMSYLSHSDVQRDAAQVAGIHAPDALTLALLAVAVAAAGGVMGLLGLVLTHRVAGPVHVMTQQLQAISAGRFPRLRPLRQHDELRGFFERLQAALEALRTREAHELELIAQAITELQPIAHTAEARRALDRLAALHDRKRGAMESPAA